MKQHTHKTTGRGLATRALTALTALGCGAIAFATLAQQEGPASGAAKPEETSAPTQAERAIERARTTVERSPDAPGSHVALGVAMSRRARETADPEWYDRSDEALDRALELAPEHFVALRQKVWNQLGRHEFADALEAAEELNERAKDDVATYGLLVDANVELGRYAEAEEAAQWMLNLRQGTPAAMTRVSYLREQFGDLTGASAAMTMAFHSTRPSDTEDRAWILTHLAHLESERGRAGRASVYAENALELFPGYHYALAELARARADAGEDEAARDLLARRYEVAPHPENLYALAVATERCGDPDAAEAMYEEFEEAALGESENVDNANLSLAEYWLDHVGSEAATARALALMEARAEVRRDIPTLEMLAWSQHRAGDHGAAWETIGEALEVGTTSPSLRLKAGDIAAAAGLREDAEEQWEMVIRTAPDGPDAALARERIRGERR